MEKVPVGKSISHAYEFLFGRFFPIIGMAWLPALIYAFFYYLWLRGATALLAPHDAAAVVNTIFATGGLVLVTWMAMAVLGISLTQEALGIRKDIIFAHFIVGPRETRLFFALLRYLLVTVALAVAVIVLSVSALVMAQKYGQALIPPAKTGGVSVALVAAIMFSVVLAIAFILAVLRLGFLLIAVAAVETHAKLTHAWRLSHGSGWRIVLVLGGTFLPVLVIAGAVAYFPLGPSLLAVLHASRASTQHMLLQFLSANAVAIAGIAGIVVAFCSALLAGATATAYRTVTGHAEVETPDDAALVAPLMAPPEHEPAHEEHLPAVHDTGHGHSDPVLDDSEHVHAHADGHHAGHAVGHGHAGGDGHDGHVVPHGQLGDSGHPAPHADSADGVARSESETG